MKIPTITGLVHKVAPVRTVPRGFAQTVIVTQPVRKNEQGYVLSKEQFFVIHIWSNKQDDRRFLKKEFEGAQCYASCYLDGQRWQGKRDLEYNHRLNLDTWLDETGKPAIK